MKRDCVSLLLDMLRIYSPSGSERELALFLASELEELGFLTRIDNVGNLIACAGSGRPAVLLCGHLDTVPGFIEVEARNGKLVGRGAVDAKGPFAAMIFGALEFADSGKRGSITLLGCVEEETSGKGIKHAVRTLPEFDYAIVGEPSGIDRITIGYRGRLQVALKCRTKGGHAGSAWLYTSAVEEAYEAWRAIRKRISQVGPDKFHSTSACLTEIRGGEAANVVPSSCELAIDVRIPPGREPSDVLRAIEAELEARKASFELCVKDCLRAFEVDRESPLVGCLRRAIREVIGRPAILTRKTGSSDAGLLLGKARSIAIYGPGDPRLEHRKDEAIDRAELVLSVPVYKRALELLSERFS